MTAFYPHNFAPQKGSPMDCRATPDSTGNIIELVMISDSYLDSQLLKNLNQLFVELKKTKKTWGDMTHEEKDQEWPND